MTRIADLIDVPLRDAPSLAPAHVPLADGFSALPWTACTGAAFREAWHQLARRVQTPNPFCEQWFLEPSLRQFDPQGQVMLATLVEAGELVGLMPLWRDRDYHGRPMPHLANWLHANSFCGEPLVARGHAERFWEEVLSWCDRTHRASLFLHMGYLPTGGCAFQTLEALTHRDRRSFVPVKRIRRAALRHGLSPHAHLAAAMDKKRRKELDRKRRRLAEEGDLQFTRCCDGQGIAQWIDEFLMLERSGWKGAESSALSCAPQTETLFREAIEAAALHGRLERLAFHLDGRPVAMLCNFLTPPIGFGFKTAFDESLKKFSPGMLLQVENLSVLERSDIAVSDSCAAPGHPMAEQIWCDRRELAMVNIGIGGTVRRKAAALLSAIELRREEKRR